jgi:CO/xanthine dehydrogenase FAD-binding subunit
VAASLKFSADGTVEDSKIILGGVGSHPIEATAAEKVIAGKRLTEGIIREAAQAAYQPAKPLDNTDFAMTWRKEMARFYVAGTLRELSAP